MQIIEESVKIVTPIPWYGLIFIAILIFLFCMLVGTGGFTEDVGIGAIFSGIITIIISLFILFGTNLTQPRKQFYAKVGSISYEEMSEYKVIDRIGKLDDENALYILEEKPE